MRCFQQERPPDVGEIIACANQKGGVGKTTTVISLAAYLALGGLRVLIIDLDQQGNATSGLGLDTAEEGRSVYRAIVDQDPVAELVRPTAIGGLSIVPSARELSGAEVELVPVTNREHRLRTALAPVVDDYDYILMDCPPSLGLVTVNGLTAADSVLIPIQCEYYALEGLSQLMTTIDLVRSQLNPSLHLKGVVLTMFDARTTLSADVSAEVRRHLGDQVFNAVVPRSVRLAEAPGYGRPIALYSPASRGAQAYGELAAELLARDGRTPIGGRGSDEAAWVTR